MEWKTDKHWRYETFPLDEPVGTFGEFSSLIDLWRSKREDGFPAPQWSAFELSDLTEWWGWMHIYDAVDRNEASFRVRLWGTRLLETLGYDPSGQILHAKDGAEASDAKRITRNDLIFARYLLDNSLFGRGAGPIDLRFGEAVSYTEIMMPLSNSEGELDKLLYACRVHEDYAI